MAGLILRNILAGGEEGGGRRRTSGMTASVTESGSFLLPPFLPTAVLKTARKTTPKDAAHRWRQNVENVSQN